MNVTRPPDYQHTNLFGGQGEVSIWNLSQASMLSPFECALACQLTAGGSVGAHRQEHFAEIVVVTAGQGTATVDGRDMPLSPGALVQLPLGSTLALANGSLEAPLCYLIIKAGG